MVKRASYRLAQTAPRAVFSALDLGTNNCRLLIARPTPRGFRIIDAFSRVVRLGEGVSRSGQLSPAAMDRAIEALSICARKIERRQVTCLRSVATEACRSAANCASFVDRVKGETGLNLDVITPAEEARLAVLGCQALMDPAMPYALVFDIGGGSTELIFVERRGRDYRILAWTSIPWGVVNLSEAYDGLHITPQRYGELQAFLADYFDPFEAQHRFGDKVQAGQVQLLGTSGTVTTLASLYLGLPGYNRRQVDGLWMARSELMRIAEQVVSMTYQERCDHPCIGTDRADLVVAGCAILEQILTLWPSARLRVADRGIREGILRALMGQGDRVHLPLPKG
ncbi:MAG: Ppx/GppA phosphatase family protein [Rhodothalassiaceae bacterium]